MVKQDFTVGVVDYGLFHDFRRNDVLHFLRDDNRLAVKLSDRFVEVLYIGSHVCRSDRLPSLLDGNDLADTLQPSHFVDEQLHNDNGRYREEDGVILYRINFKDNEPLVQQVQFLVRVQQVVILTATIVRFKHIQESGKVKVLLPHFLLLQPGAVLRSYKLVEGIEGRPDRIVIPDAADVEGDRIGNGYFLGTGSRLVVLFPQRKQQGLDALPFLNIEHVVLRVKRIERNRILIRIGVIDSVLAVSLAVYHPAQTLIAVARIHDDDVRSLLVILSHEMIHEKGLAASGRSEDELVAVGRHTPLHRQVADVDMERLACQPVHHLQPERRNGVPVVGFPGEKAHRLLYECVEALLRREIRLIAGYACPEQGRTVHRVVARSTLHGGELAARLVLDALEFFRIVAPRHDIEMCTDGCQAETVRLVQVFLYPFLVDGVAPGVP